MAFTIEQSITIDAPVEAVWEYVTTEDAWRRPFIKDVAHLDDGPPAPGSRYENAFEIGGSKGTVINEVTEVEPPTHLAWFQPEGQGGPVRVIDGAYDLEAVGGKTRFTLSNTYEGNGWWRLVTPIMRIQVARSVYPQMLEQLKEHVEERADATD